MLDVTMEAMLKRLGPLEVGPLQASDFVKPLGITYTLDGARGGHCIHPSLCGIWFA
jgi:hypothetical protein